MFELKACLEQAGLCFWEPGVWLVKLHHDLLHDLEFKFRAEGI